MACPLAIVIALNPMLLGVLLVFVGRYDASRKNSPLLEAHERATKSFVESEGFGISRFSPTKLWNEISVSYQGQEYRSEKIRLIGLTPEHGNRIFTESFPPRKYELDESENRSLTEAEANAVKSLRNRSTGESIVSDGIEDKLRVILPLYATKACLKCHSVAEGEILGAFDYSLVEFEY